MTSWYAKVWNNRGKIRMAKEGGSNVDEDEKLAYLRYLYGEYRKLCWAQARLDEAYWEGKLKADARFRRQKRRAIILAVVAITAISLLPTLIWLWLRHG